MTKSRAQWLLDNGIGLFKQRGYSVAVNFPYSGCLVPGRFQRDARVPAIMIEINRRLYLKPASRDVYRLGNVPLKLDTFDVVRNDVWSIVLSLVQILTCKGATSVAAN